MLFIPSKLVRYLPLGAVILLGGVAGIVGMSTSLSAQAQGEEPIAYIGHGGFFDHRGKQIVPTQEWVMRTQDWYRAKLSGQLDSKGKGAFAVFERRVGAIKAEGQALLIVRQRSLEWLLVNAPLKASDQRTAGKINAIGYQLNFRLPVPGVEAKADGGLYRLDPAIERQLAAPELQPRGPRRNGGGGGMAMLSSVVDTMLTPTTNQGQPYLDQCDQASNSVPKPPTINVMDQVNGTTGWKTEGLIPKNKQFITGTPAEIRSFTSSKGVCIALPRYTDDSKTVVMLDGVICLSRTTSKVCIWDNQKFDPVTMKPKGFSFGATEQVPIGVLTPAINATKFQSGGAGLENGTGGVCTDCHAGENPYIIHPDVVIAPGKTMADLRTTLPMMPPQRYDPLVAASWPQNALSHAEALVPGACVGCHRQGATRAGRFPHLSTALNGTVDDPSGYCNTILRQALQRTMPQGSPPGSSLNDQEVTDFVNWCEEPGTSNPNGGSDRGDPHLVTTNGVSYDFQSAGEFTALRNTGTGFELQTRQTPVTTSFIPGTNPYTGLASCVSLNTAAAVRLGKRRVTYQPGKERMELRVDGKLVQLARGGLNLGGRNRLITAASGTGIQVTADDGTRVVITPEFWASQGYNYLNIEVLTTPAREGVMGHIRSGQWLPFGPNRERYGPAPGSLALRGILLHQTFANAWRVTSASSLFDYAPGTSTVTFTDPGWPPKAGMSCSAAAGVPTIPGPGGPKVRPVPREKAVQMCRPLIRDRAAYDQCVFDTMVMGDANVPAAYARTRAARSTAF